ncbi:hypothetical protein B0H13DRAFT_1867709 [Mycena leptocephala]|nr:hypothetical protein B0H13DRAFT_1867709 [Mycena leptocephala]
MLMKYSRGGHVGGLAAGSLWRGRSAGEGPARSRSEATPVAGPRTACSSQMQTSDIQMGVEECEQREPAPGEDEEGVRGHVGMYDEYWQRDDRAEWTDELWRAHAAFERGRSCGLGWAVFVQKFFDFEDTWGFNFIDGAWQMPKQWRPQQVTEWISRGRKWSLPQALSGLLGSRQAKGQAEALWVGLWWAWLRSLRPKERAVLENGSRRARRLRTGARWWGLREERPLAGNGGVGMVGTGSGEARGGGARGGDGVGRLVLLGAVNWAGAEFEIKS